METLVLVVHVLLAIAIVALVLLQQGKGAEAGAAFGGGASQTVFGSQGSSSFLVRFTSVLALGLFVTSFVLAVYAKNHAAGNADAGVPAAAVVEQAQKQSADDKVTAGKADNADVPNESQTSDVESQKSAPNSDVQKSAPASDIPTVNDNQ